MLSAAELVDYLKFKGITFNAISEADAKVYLTQNSNYFKLTAFRKNYLKNSKGKYIGLDFAYLVDIATIDMRLRYCLIQMCLDIEHCIRVNLINKVQAATGEDGYSIVKEYRDKYTKSVDEVYSRAGSSPYCKDLIHKHQSDMPIWAFVEIMQFASLNNFYKFVAEHFSDETMSNQYYLFQEVRQLRNACAHSNCILNDLNSKESDYKADLKLMLALSQIGISKDVRQSKMKNDRIRQVTTLLYVYRLCVRSQGMLAHRTALLHELFDERVQKNWGYYASSEQIMSTFKFLKLVVDEWFPICYNTTTVQKP